MPVFRPSPRQFSPARAGRPEATHQNKVSITERDRKRRHSSECSRLPPRPIPGPHQSSSGGESGPKRNPPPAFLFGCRRGSFSHDPHSGLAGTQRLALMRVELGFDNSLCLVDVERLELGITGFTDADYGNVLGYDPEITFWHEHRLSGSLVGRHPNRNCCPHKLGRPRKSSRDRGVCITGMEPCRSARMPKNNGQRGYSRPGFVLPSACLAQVPSTEPALPRFENITNRGESRFPTSPALKSGTSSRP
jgi:hypothetical protein